MQIRQRLAAASLSLLTLLGPQSDAADPFLPPLNNSSSVPANGYDVTNNLSVIDVPLD
jgi:hypothetical protein